MVFSGKRGLLVIFAWMAMLNSSPALQGPGAEASAIPIFSPEAAATFNKRCTACHTYGKGVKVGPDLKGVNDRRKRDWLLKFIHASSKVIQSGDPVATGLFAQFKQQRMPDWTDLSDKQINDILDYIAVGGPDIKPADERNAEAATAAEINRGQQFFYGQEPFKYGAHACATCHSVAGSGMAGGTLGPDLSTVYTRYQDRALTEFLRHPCFQWEDRVSGTQYLSPAESFNLKAFLRRIAIQQTASEARANRNGQADASVSKPGSSQPALSAKTPTGGRP